MSGNIIVLRLMLITYIYYSLDHNISCFCKYREVATVGDHLNIEVCMDIMDLLYEKEETSTLYSSPHSLAASILVCFSLFFIQISMIYFYLIRLSSCFLLLQVASYVISVPKQRWEFPLLPCGKFPLLYPSYLLFDHAYRYSYKLANLPNGSDKQENIFGS